MSKYAIGVDLGGTKILTGLVNTKTGEVISTSKKKTKMEFGTDYIIERIIETITKTIEQSEINKSEIIAIGIGAAGQVNRKEGILISAPNLDCANLEFKKILEKQFKIPVVLGNDVEVATIGEKSFGAGRDCENFVCIFVGTGIGSGIIHNGEVYHGATGTAGEVGHIIVQPNGRLCGCGNNGCMEAYSSRTAISKKISAAIKKGNSSVLSQFYETDPNFKLRSKHLSIALDEDDELTINCVTEAADYFSVGLATIINFYNPEKIILGGGLIEAVDFFFDMITKKVKNKCLPVPANSIEICKTQLGDHSGIVGAAIMAIDRKDS
ncbi:MAG: ROK family protein [Cyanobacteriota bacterium]